MEEYTIRQGRKEDMAGLLALVLEEGWNNVIDHLQFQFELFPSGVFVAEGSNGEIISHCSSVPLDDSTGFIAFYITKKSWRGKGVGRKVFDLSYKALGSRQVGLNAAWNRQEMYASGGFKISTFQLTSYMCPIKNLTLKQHEPTKETYKVSSLKDVDFQSILAFDKKIHQIARTEILKWFIEFAHVGLAIMEGNEVRGWGTLYRSHSGFRLMPLYAESVEHARVLANELLKSAVKTYEATIEVAFPDDNIEAKMLYEELGVTKGKCSYNRRMFTEYDVHVQNNLVYSILNYDNVLA